MSSSNGNARSGLLSRLLPGRRPDDAAYHPVLLDRKQFQWALDRERARSERCESEYVLVRIQLAENRKNGNGSNGHGGGNGHSKRNGFLSHLGAVVGERMRQSDLAGMCEEGIGLVLPDMSSEAVEHLVHDIERLFHRRVEERYGAVGNPPEIACEIFYSAN